MENKENLVGHRRKTVATFGHDDEDETDSYFTNDDLQSEGNTKEEQGTFNRLLTTLLPGIWK